jgi:secreted trypsin-like serine protease
MDHFGPFSAKWIEVEACGEDDLAAAGDSGGPVFFGNTAIGITSFDEGDFFCPNKMLFNSITQVQNALGVHILLAP